MRQAFRLAAFFVGLIVLSHTAAFARQPNVVLVLVDDLGWTDLSCYGSEYYETRHIDRLAKEGVRFTDAYASCAVCSPTRAAVMTGRYPARVGVTDWIRARFQGGALPENGKNPTRYVRRPNLRLACPPNPLWLEHEEVTVAERLKVRNYTSCHIGKWHLGLDDWYPEKQGFDFNFGGCDYGQPPSYFDPYTNRRLAIGIPTLKPREKGEYLTDREADEAVRFIAGQKDRPFFLFLANYAVHTPIQAREDLTEYYRKKGSKTKQRNPKYAAMVHSVDDAMGRVLAALADNGLDRDTLILFTSDNGGLLGPTHNAPLRSGKGNPYEGGIRVPLIARWPGVIPGGRVSSQIASSIDLLPTILEACGVESDGPVIDGRSLLPHLRSGSALTDKPVFWHFPHYRGRIAPYSIVRHGKYKLLKRYDGTRFELYDLEKDLAEKDDLAPTMPKIVRKLNRKLNTWLVETGAKIPFPNQQNAPANRLTDRETQDGWKLLFDGESLAGWKTSHGKESARPVEDASLNPHKSGHYMLVHDERWSNFILSLDFKISKGCNSGVFFRTHSLTELPGRDVGFNGLEVAIDDTEGNDYHESGAIYGLARANENVMRPAGQWNRLILVCDDNLVRVILNGEDVTRMDLDRWEKADRRPDGSKHKFTGIAYRDHPRSGFIGLQDHGSNCWFRNIKILPFD
ncbi:MAG: sulfatase-like hydrolase/transferase [Planctomycetota bacterium]